MADIFLPRQGWGSDGRRATLSITFDNLGEAGEVEPACGATGRSVSTTPRASCRN